MTSPTPHSPTPDGTLAARLLARVRSRRAKAANTREASRWAVRASCASYRPPWAFRPPRRRGRRRRLPRAERDRGLSPNTLDLCRAAIRYLHHATGCPSPTDEALVGATLAGIRRDARNPAKKRAATVTVLRELLAPSSTTWSVDVIAR